MCKRKISPLCVSSLGKVVLVHVLQLLPKGSACLFCSNHLQVWSDTPLSVIQLVETEDELRQDVT